MSGDFCLMHGPLIEDFREHLEKILDGLDELRKGQSERREICAAERTRIETLERDIDTLANKESRDLWEAINELRRLVHRGAGLVLALAASMPIVTGTVVYLLTRGIK